MIGTICVISFLLDGYISSCISMDSLFYPLFSIICLIVIFPYFKHRDKKFFYYAGGLGFLYDLVYTDTLYLNFLLFLLLALSIRQLYFWFSSNILSTIFLSFLSIIFYRFTTYFLLVLIGYLPLKWHILWEGIYSSILLNILYSVLLYLICDYLARSLKKVKLK